MDFNTIIEWSIQKEALKLMINRMEMAYHLIKNIYNKWYISINSKLRHYCIVFRPETTCNKISHNKREAWQKKMGTKERKILRKILGPVIENSEYRWWHNQELHTCMEKIMDIIYKRRILFYNHILQMKILQKKWDWPTNLYQHDIPKGAWFTKVVRVLQEIGITHTRHPT